MFRKENENHKKENILANVPMNIIWTVMRYGIENEKHKTASATDTPLAPVKRVKHQKKKKPGCNTLFWISVRSRVFRISIRLHKWMTEISSCCLCPLHEFEYDNTVLLVFMQFLTYGLVHCTCNP